MTRPLQHRRVATLLLALLAAVPRVAAGQDSLSFRHLTIADGLSQNAVTAIVQGHRGFMWLGTRDGLDRYDGYEFVVFRHDPSDSTSIPHSEVTALFEDSHGRLWVGTRGGLSRFDAARETFARFPSGPGGGVTAIVEDHGGNLWIGTDGEGLFRLAAGTDTAFQRFGHDDADPRSASSDRVFAVLVDHRGVLWASTDRGLDRLGSPTDPEGGFTHYGPDPSSSTGLIDTSASALYEDAAGRLWVGSVPGVTVFNADRTRTQLYYHRYRTFRYGWGLVNDLVEDPSGHIWIATRSELMILDPKTGAFRYVQHDPLQPDGISGDMPTALYRDRSNVIWVGTNGYGLNIHDPKGTRFHTFRRPEERPYRHSGFSVYTLFEDAAGTIWIDAGLLYRWDRATGAFKSFETSSDRPDDFGNTSVWSIIEAPRGLLWAATDQGLYHYDIATGRARQYRHDPADSTSLPEKTARDVLRTRDGSIWVVTESYVARLVDPRSGRFESWRYRNLPATGAWTFPSTVEDAHGDLWFGSNEGLVRFDPATASFRRFRSDPAQPTSLSNDVVKSILPDPREPTGSSGSGPVWEA